MPNVTFKIVGNAPLSFMKWKTAIVPTRDEIHELRAALGPDIDFDDLSAQEAADRLQARAPVGWKVFGPCCFWGAGSAAAVAVGRAKGGDIVWAKRHVEEKREEWLRRHCYWSAG